MSSNKLTIFQLNQIVIEKMKIARDLANTMNRKTPDGSSPETYLNCISDMLDEAIDILYDQMGCLPPAVDLQPVAEPESTDKIITIVPSSKKAAWTAERKKQQSEIIKQRWAAKKAAAVVPAPAPASPAPKKSDENEGFKCYMQERLITEIGTETPFKDIRKDYKFWLVCEPEIKMCSPDEIRKHLQNKFGKFSIRRDIEYVKGVRFAGITEDVSSNFIEIIKKE